MAMAMGSLDLDAVQQLLAIGQQYVKVEQEMKSLAEELKTSRKRRRQLAAEVRECVVRQRSFAAGSGLTRSSFLHEKLRSFQRAPELDGPSQAAHHLKSMEAPQFYEVEVKFADSLESGMMDSMGFEYPPSYPPSIRDSQNEFVQDRQDKFLA